MTHILPVFFCFSPADRWSSPTLRLQKLFCHQMRAQVGSTDWKAEQGDKRMSDNTRRDWTSIDRRLLELPSVLSTQVMKHVESLTNSGENKRGSGSSIWSAKQSFGGLAAIQQRSPTEGQALQCWVEIFRDILSLKTFSTCQGRID